MKTYNFKNGALRETPKRRDQFMSKKKTKTTKDKLKKPDLIDHIGNFLFRKKSFSKHIKSLTAICSIAGFSCLIWYCSKYDVPFPIELTTLPILFLAMVFISLFFVLALLLMLLLPFTLPDTERSKDFNRKKYGFKKLYTKKSYWHYLFTHGIVISIPQLALIAFVANEGNFENVWPIFWSVTSIFIFIFVISHKSKKSKISISKPVPLYNLLSIFRESKFKIIWLRLAYSAYIIFIAAIWTFVLLCIAIQMLLVSPLNNPSHSLYLFDKDELSIALVLCISAILIYINYLLVKLGYKKQIKDIAIRLLVFTFLLFLIPSFASPFFGKVSLSILNLGGNSPTCYEFDQGLIKKVPTKAYIPDTNISKPLYKVLDSSSYVYVKLDKEDSRAFSIQKKFITSESLLPKIKYKEENEDGQKIEKPYSCVKYEKPKENKPENNK